MFRKVLIANRGEIAIRIIRTLREMGIASVAVFSEADRDSLHVKLADEAICIGPPSPRESYLKVAHIISAAEVTGAEAIHPGYGFMSENSEFARICAGHELVFVGPSPEAIEQLGDKATARKMMIEAGVPVVPGSVPLVDENDAQKWLEKIGAPVMLKAAGGGGGRGMRIVRSGAEVKDAFLSARREAENAFSDGRIYMEKYVERARHVEVQIIGDNTGTVIHLGERDCSVQRRHQKLVEESPAPGLTVETREKLCAIACQAGRAAGYTSAGTVEFLHDVDSGEFYFMEMNSRVQVEHPVTEMVTGVDIIREQLRVAAGLPLSLRQEDVRMNGHAIECRLNAEDPSNGFSPCAGFVSEFLPPGGFGVRIDSFLFTGCEVPPYYDAMVGKLIAWGEDRPAAIARMRRALAETRLEGIRTTIPFHQELLTTERFCSGDVDTRMVEEWLAGK